jgi:hypothetical protein
MALAFRCRTRPTCWPGRGTIAADIGRPDAHHNTISAATNRLKATQWTQTRVLFHRVHRKSHTTYTPQRIPTKGDGAAYVEFTDEHQDHLRAGRIDYHQARTYLRLKVLTPHQRTLPVADIAALAGTSPDKLRRHWPVLAALGMLPAHPLISRKTSDSLDARRVDHSTHHGVARTTPSAGTTTNAELPSARAADTGHQRARPDPAARAETPQEIIGHLPTPWRTAQHWIREKMGPLIDAVPSRITARAIVVTVTNLGDQQRASMDRQIPTLSDALTALVIDVKAGTRCADCGQIEGGSELCATCHPDRPWTVQDQAAWDASPLRAMVAA